MSLALFSKLLSQHPTLKDSQGYVHSTKGAGLCNKEMNSRHIMHIKNTHDISSNIKFPIQTASKIQIKIKRMPTNQFFGFPFFFISSAIVRFSSII